MKKISIVTPVFNEGQNIGPFFQALCKVTDSIPEFQFRFIFVNDGSTDQSGVILDELETKNANITVIHFSRNFGKEAALTAGLRESDCDATIMIDADLQHPPQYIPQMLEKWSEGYEVVIMRRKTTNSSFTRKFGSFVFYKILNLISDTEVIAKSTDFRLIDKEVVDTVNAYTERRRMMRALVDWSGYNRVILPFDSPNRHSGKPTYSYFQLLRLAINTFTAHSLFPLRAAGYLGIFLCVVFGLLFCVMGVDRLFFNHFGFTNLGFVIVVNSFLIGFVLSCLGLIALYIGTIHTEVLNRPLYIKRKRGRSKTNPATKSRPLDVRL